MSEAPGSIIPPVWETDSPPSTEPNIRPGKRTLARINGRCLVITDSPTLQFVEKDKVHTFPFFEYNKVLPKGYGYFFICELNGWLSFEQNAFYQISEQDVYQRANFSLDTLTTVLLPGVTPALVQDRPHPDKDKNL